MLILCSDAELCMRLALLCHVIGLVSNRSSSGTGGRGTPCVAWRRSRRGTDAAPASQDVPATDPDHGASARGWARWRRLLGPGRAHRLSVAAHGCAPLPDGSMPVPRAAKWPDASAPGTRRAGRGTRWERESGSGAETPCNVHHDDCCNVAAAVRTRARARPGPARPGQQVTGCARSYSARRQSQRQNSLIQRRRRAVSRLHRAGRARAASKASTNERALWSSQAVRNSQLAS